MKIKKIDLVYILIAVLIVTYTIVSIISYMSINSWDIRCLFTECKPVSIRENNK